MADTAPITPADVTSMVSHWLGCPPGGYLGSDYGAPIKDVLMSPMAGGKANDLISKARQDVPILANAPAGSINVYSYQRGIDQIGIALDVGGQVVSVEDK